MRPKEILDPTSVDLEACVADREGIARVNPHRRDMVQLDRVVLLDFDRQLIAGYKDVSPEEFWVPGHFPGMPVLPGVLMCEAGAQLCGYYISSQGIMGDNVIGFGGMENVRFRQAVRPGERLVIVGVARRLNRRQTTFHVQGFVGGEMAFHGDIIGVAIARREELAE